LAKVKEAQELRNIRAEPRSSTNLSIPPEISRAFPQNSKSSDSENHNTSTVLQINVESDAKNTAPVTTLSPIDTLNILSTPPLIPLIEQPASVNSKNTNGISNVLNNVAKNTNGNINKKSTGTVGNAVAPRPSLAEQYPIRILYAEDNPINQRLFSRMLGKFGYQVDIAEHGLKALQMMALKGADDQYEVVFLDMQMPECDGLTCASHIISLYRESRPRMVAITANAMAKDREACLAAGMDDYIAKPISFPILEQKLIKWGEYVMALRQTAASQAGANSKKPTSKAEELHISSEPNPQVSITPYIAEV
jgi:CheY-like chemotaxis protein